MTPERIEEIKGYVEYHKEMDSTATRYVNELLAALEEAQQELLLEQERKEGYWAERYAEAQQTIAQLNSLMNDAIGSLIICTSQENEHVKRIVKGFRAARGNEEGDSES